MPHVRPILIPLIWLPSHHLKSPFIQFSPTSCHVLPLTAKCLPQHHVLQHPQPVLLRQYERPSFTPSSSTYFNLHILRYKIGLNTK
jgi:hypothetical protein